MRVILSNILAIYRKELQSYFVSPFAYTLAGIFWLMMGFFFVYILLGPDGIVQQVQAMEQSGIPVPPLDVPYEFVQRFLLVLGSLSLFVLPILSMGLYVEERKRGTLELLATSPITNWTVATGKLLGVVTFFTTMVLPLLVCEAIALSAAKPPMPPGMLVLGHIGLILLAASVLSLGMFISSLTDSTILAAVLTFVLVLFLWAIDLVAHILRSLEPKLPLFNFEISFRPLGEALGHLSLLTHYTNLIKGILDSSSLILFASYIVLGVFLTAQSIDALRFQRT